MSRVYYCSGFGSFYTRDPYLSYKTTTKTLTDLSQILSKIKYNEE